MNRDAGLAHLDVYLDQVRRNLRGLPEAEMAEILAELRSHVLDRLDGDTTPVKVEAAIEALGSPREIARANLAERTVARMDADPSWLAVPRAVVRLATISLYGFFAFMVSLIGYGMGAGLMLTAIAKPFAPANVGLWREPGPGDGPSFTLGVMDKVPHARELLGWWVIPLGLVLGALVLWITWKFGTFSVRFIAAGSRRKPRLRAAIWLCGSFAPVLGMVGRCKSSATGSPPTSPPSRGSPSAWASFGRPPWRCCCRRWTAN